MLEMKVNRTVKLREDFQAACLENIAHFEKDKSSSGNSLCIALRRASEAVKLESILIEDVATFMHGYDFDEAVPGNGYRSFVAISDTCVAHLFDTCKQIRQSRNSILFQKGWYLREVDSYCTLLMNVCSCLQSLVILRKWAASDDLFPTDIHTAHELFEQGNSVNLLPFYGRCLGFQYSSSMKKILTFICACMAGFSESYFLSSNRLLKFIVSSWKGCSYLFDPASRAKRIVHIVQNADVDFCKAFWSLSEGKLMSFYPSLVGAKVEVNKLLNIPPEPVQIYSSKSACEIFVPVPASHFGPKSVSARLISSKRRKGMIGEYGANFPQTSSLIIHCHGGGFVAHSSKSHEIYLRDWANDLDVPIISIDYSLAPDAPYPRALEEVFHIYCWAVKNSFLLGSHGTKIILVGDSAGSNLNLGVTLKCIELGIRQPNGLFIAYCPFLVSFVPSPARLLCLMDPLLPFGFMMRCLKSYVSPDSSVVLKNLKLLESLRGILCVEAESHIPPSEHDADTLKSIPNTKSQNIKYGEATRIDENPCDLFHDNKMTVDATSSPNIYANEHSFPGILENPANEFNFKIPEDPYLSPYLANEDILRMLPSTKILTLEMDPCLDDSVMFAKKLKRLGVPVTLDILTGLPHGFLNLVKVSKQADEGSELCVKRIKELLS